MVLLKPMSDQNRSLGIEQKSYSSNVGMPRKPLRTKRKTLQMKIKIVSRMG
jgi:hypothetical protein